MKDELSTVTKFRCPAEAYLCSKEIEKIGWLGALMVTQERERKKERERERERESEKTEGLEQPWNTEGYKGVLYRVEPLGG